MKNRSSMIVFRKCRCKDFAGIVCCFDSFGPSKDIDPAALRTVFKRAAFRSGYDSGIALYL